MLVGGALMAGGYTTRDNDAGSAIATAAVALATARIFEVPVMGDDHRGGPLGAAYADAFRPIPLVLGGVSGLAIGVLGTQEKGTSRAAFSIAGGTVFTLLSIAGVWSL